MAPLRSVLADTFIGIDHVGIAVPDLESALVDWAAMGLKSYHQEINESQGVAEAMLKVIEGLDLQLLASASENSTIAKFLARQGPGMQQIAVKVTNLEAAMALIKTANMRLIYEEPMPGTAGSWINFIHPKDVGGVLVELVQSA
ncbi:MAG: methylmalonyl-CoA epimerase [Actinobacteria bacterium]|uniref:Unannotated protein n=1 Tax=freshwater metagenome TaxID=449393 RepID=A0A6J5ZTZ5_9ZZZZ|nr:methylmalonyl-CoA epimerase [Actinomycetota bacterium]